MKLVDENLLGYVEKLTETENGPPEIYCWNLLRMQLKKQKRTPDGVLFVCRNEYQLLNLGFAAYLANDSLDGLLLQTLLYLLLHLVKWWYG